MKPQVHLPAHTALGVFLSVGASQKPFTVQGEGGRGGSIYVMLVPSAPTRENKQEGPAPPEQWILKWWGASQCCAKATCSFNRCGNKVTETAVSTETTAENN